MNLNADIPPIECFVRAEYMRQHRDGHGKRIPCLIFGVTSLPGQVPLFHFLTPDGGIWWRMPISAFCHVEDAPAVDLGDLCLWDSFSRDVSVTRFDFLANKKMQYRDRHGETIPGRYMFTLDWGSPDGMGFAEVPGQHKCGHLIKRDDGNFAIQPNNRLLVFEPSFTTQFGKPVLERFISDRLYTVEDRPKSILSDDERYDYDVGGT